MPQPNEIFAVDYAARNAQISHYSNIRSALTTFIISVALGTLIAHIGLSPDEKNISGYVLLYCSRLFLVVAVLVCLNFSFRTEKTIMKMKQIWIWAHARNNPDYPKDYEPKLCDILKRMRKDKMNWLLIIVVSLIFYWTF